MYMHKKNESPKKGKKTFKKLLIIIGYVTTIIIAIVGVFLGKSLYDTYHDRPLADGLQYIGRDYNSPCYFGTCYGPTTETYYYATDIVPDDIIKLFPDWKVEEAIKGDEVLRNQDTSYTVGYNLINSRSGAHAFYEYIANSTKTISTSHLIKTDKKYIIFIPREDYDTLRKSK